MNEIPKPPWHDLDDIFHREFEGESDRASVILAAAMLESAIETMLRTRLVPVSSSDDSLFDGSNAPVGTFAAKIDLAHRIGLLPANFARDLHLIRRVRNDFAHDVSGCSFSSPTVAQRVLELVRRQGVVESAPDKRKGYPPGKRGDFQLTVSWMLAVLWSTAEQVEPIRARSELLVRDLEERKRQAEKRVTPKKSGDDTSSD